MFSKLLITLFVCVQSSLFSCQIIYLNGPSSVGKTTLAKALQEEFKSPYLHIGLDQIIAMMPEKVNWLGGRSELGFSWKKSCDAQGKPLQIFQVGPYGAQIPGMFRDIVAALAKKGNNVIIDDVAFETDAAEAWKTALKDSKVLWIGLTAPLEVIEKREIERGDRQLGQARAIYDQIHTGFSYDLFLNTSEESLSEMVQKIKLKCDQMSAKD